jgi:hypothetical protein
MRFTKVACRPILTQHLSIKGSAESRETLSFLSSSAPKFGISPLAQSLHISYRKGTVSRLEPPSRNVIWDNCAVEIDFAKRSHHLVHVQVSIIHKRFTKLWKR